MLAGNEGADGAVEVTPEETTPASVDVPDQSDRKGTFIKEHHISQYNTSSSQFVDFFCIFPSFKYFLFDMSVCLF